MNPSIRFSHFYPKLMLNGLMEQYVQTAVLLWVHEIRLKELSPEMLNYDTGNGLYNFSPQDDRMNMLFFTVSKEGPMFTTIRPLSSDDYYRSRVGQVFNIQIKGRDY